MTFTISSLACDDIIMRTHDKSRVCLFLIAPGGSINHHYQSCQHALFLLLHLSLESWKSWITMRVPQISLELTVNLVMDHNEVRGSDWLDQDQDLVRKSSKNGIPHWGQVVGILTSFWFQVQDTDKNLLHKGAGLVYWQVRESPSSVISLLTGASLPPRSLLATSKILWSPIIRIMILRRWSLRSYALIWSRSQSLRCKQFPELSEF